MNIRVVCEKNLSGLDSDILEYIISILEDAKETFNSKDTIDSFNETIINFLLEADFVKCNSEGSKVCEKIFQELGIVRVIEPVVSSDSAPAKLNNTKPTKLSNVFKDNDILLDSITTNKTKSDDKPNNIFSSLDSLVHKDSQLKEKVLNRILLIYHYVYNKSSFHFLQYQKEKKVKGTKQKASDYDKAQIIAKVVIP